MSPNAYALLWEFGFFMAFMLVPMVPAIIIYSKFPKDKISATGVLGKLTINATGAFAGYLIVLLVCRYTFSFPNYNTLVENFSSTDDSPWSVKAHVVFKKKNGQQINSISDADIKRNLEILFSPDYYEKNLNRISFSTYYKKGNEPILSFNYPGFEPRVINLADRDSSMKFFYSGKKIDLGNIELTNIDQDYAPNPAVTIDTSFNGPSFND